MKEEMNLYKRCKNIFKAHGVDFGGGVSSENVPSDWNQNDETAADYVKNRPFYDKSIVTHIVPESTVVFSDINGSMGAYWPESFDAVEGQTYTISWDGADYECELTQLYGALVIGNTALANVGSDTGEPFLFLYQNQWLVTTNDSASEHVISIKIVTPQIVQIDKKYLPLSKKFVVDATNLPSNTTGWGKLRDSLNAAYNAGDEIWLDLYGDGEGLLKLVNDDGYGTYWLFMRPKLSDLIVINAYILTTYPSDGGSLEEVQLAYASYIPTSLFKNGDNSMILKSSTEGSNKKFKITVDDSGTISATEVTDV